MVTALSSPSMFQQTRNVRTNLGEHGGDFDTNAVLSLQGGDDVDIYFTCSWSADEYNKFARDGYWVRLDDPENNLIENTHPISGMYFRKC